MINTFLNIFSFFEKTQKRYFYFIFCTLLLTAVLETISVGAFLPLVSTMFDIQNSNHLNILYETFDEKTVDKFLEFESLLIIFAAIYLIKFIFLIFCNWHNKTFEMEVGRILTKQLYKKYINLNYENFFEKNSSLMLKNITSEIRVFTASVSASIFILTEFTVLIFIILFLLLIDFSSLKIILLLGSFAFLIGIFFRTKLSKQNKARRMKEVELKTLYKFLGIKEIKIFNKEIFF